MGRVGTEQSHDTAATDPGSDDFTFNWSFGPDATTATNTVFNNGSSADPLPSPDGTFPASGSSSASVIFSAPGIYTVDVAVTDDDGGSDVESLTKIVVDDCDCAKSQGFCKKQFSDKGKKGQDDKDDKIAEESLNAYLAIINFVSNVFDEEIALTGIVDASTILDPKKGKKGTGGKGSKGSRPEATGSRASRRQNGSNKASKASGTGSDPAKTREKAMNQTLAAWLNFAKGAVDLDELIDTDTDGIADTAFSDLIAEVERILLNPAATKDDLNRARKLAESVNKHDNGNPECDTGSKAGTKSETGTGRKNK